MVEIVIKTVIVLLFQTEMDLFVLTEHAIVRIHHFTPLHPTVAVSFILEICGLFYEK